MRIDDDLAKVMDAVVAAARDTMNRDEGGPFGAAVIDADGEVLSVATNTVLGDNDPTAHAEINAIRAAGAKTGSYDLSGCTLLATCYPCPMCLGATIWANIKRVVYGCRSADAKKIGFRDDFIYDFIKEGLRNQHVLELKESDREKCLSLFDEYQRGKRTVY